MCGHNIEKFQLTKNVLLFNMTVSNLIGFVVSHYLIKLFLYNGISLSYQTHVELYLLEEEIICFIIKTEIENKFAQMLVLTCEIQKICF